MNADESKLQGVSVVVPMHNGEQWITEALTSVLRESEVDEVIVIENGSTDRSVECVQDLRSQDGRLQLMRLPGRPSIPAARNHGIRNAKSEFLAFIDQDDQWTPGRIAVQMSLINESAQHSFCIGLQKFILDPSVDLADPSSRAAWFRPEWLDRPQWGYVFGSLLIRRKTFVGVGYLDENLIYGGDDVDWFARAYSRGVREIRVPDIMLLRGIHLRNASQNTAFTAEILTIIRNHVTAARPSQDPT